MQPQSIFDFDIPQLGREMAVRTQIGDTDEPNTAVTDEGMVSPTDRDRYVSVLDATLEYARDRSYAGPDYCDGLSSALLQALPVENKWLNLAVQESVKRAPIDLRPLFRVEHRRNYKGIALFTMANLNYHELVGEDADVPFDPVAEVQSLGAWLVEQRCPGYSGFCGGHRHEIQHLHTKGTPNDADIVSTAYAVKALLRAARAGVVDEEYATIARTATWFLIDDLNYRDAPEGAKIDYHMNHPDNSYTLNSAALGARMLIDLYDYFGDDDCRDRARKILDHVAAHQTDRGGWPYRIPADASHLSMDSHHNGFIIESYQRYRDVVGSDRYAETLETALSFYRNELFESDGAPNFDEQNAYPRDIHASTQGILVFTREGEFAVAAQLIEWVLTNLQVREGQFYYRKYKYHTKRVTLMRWCQAWVAYAVSEFLIAMSQSTYPESSYQ